jgi:hypothetical protein
LDCAGLGSSFHIVASGLNPLGALLHAVGSDSTYNAFARELGKLPGTGTLATSPTIAGFGTDLLLGARIGSSLISGSLAGTEFTSFGDSADNTISSTPDVAGSTAGGATANAIFVAFDSPSSLLIQIYVVGASSGWRESGHLTAPNSTSFVYSPTICTGNYQGTDTTYLAAVAGNKLWFTTSTRTRDGYAPWALVSDDVASAPDCAISNENELNIVALNKRGGVTLHKGSNSGASWVSSDLGVYTE